MTGEHLLIIILVVAGLVTAGLWKLDTLRWDERLETQRARLDKENALQQAHQRAREGAKEDRWYRLGEEQREEWAAKEEALLHRIDGRVVALLKRQAKYEEAASAWRQAVAPVQEEVPPDEETPRPRGRRGPSPVAGEPRTPDDAGGLESYTDLMVR